MATVGDLLKVAKFIKGLVEGKKSNRWELVRAYSMALCAQGYMAPSGNMTAAEELADELIARMKIDKKAIDEEAHEAGEIE